MASGERIGMNADVVNSRAQSVARRLDAVDGLAAEVQRTAWASRSPWNFGLVPGVNVVLSAATVMLAESAAADLRQALAEARRLVGVLDAQAAEQRWASSADDGSYVLGFLSAADAQRLYEEVLADPDLLTEMTPQQVAAFWSHLSIEQSDALAAKDPMLIGNLSGVPMEARVNANRLSAIAQLTAGEVSSAEHREYLESVRDGLIHLVTYDPDNDRLVEVLGMFEMDPAGERLQYAITDDQGRPIPPSTVVTYVPGTMTSNESFYGHPLREVPSWLQQQVPGSVVFIYKDGTFPGGWKGSSDSDLATGLMQANEPDRAAAAGIVLANFQSDVAREGMLVDARSVAVGHSWGFANITNSEVAGSHYDAVISISGAAAPDEWRAATGTQYSHHTYVDALSVGHDLGVVHGQDPDEIMPPGGVHLYQGPNDLALDALLTNHSLSNSTVDDAGNPENQALLYGVRNDVVGG